MEQGLARWLNRVDMGEKGSENGGRRTSRRRRAFIECQPRFGYDLFDALSEFRTSLVEGSDLNIDPFTNSSDVKCRLALLTMAPISNGLRTYPPKNNQVTT